jgi:hypothetical protein
MGGCVASVQFSRTGWEAHARAELAANAGLSKLNSMLARFQRFARALPKAGEERAGSAQDQPGSVDMLGPVCSDITPYVLTA